MSDRLAEIEARLHPEMPAYAVVGLTAAEVRDLLAVAKAAKARLETGECDHDLRAALANLKEPR